jgi:hypothetical protein
MRRSPRPSALAVALAFALSLALSACGSSETTPDAPVAQVGMCGAAVATIATLPGEYTGATIGAGAELAVAEGACAEERGWFGSNGEEQVIDVTGLTPDAYYVVELVTDEDLSFYVASGCDLVGPRREECLLHVDTTLARELAEVKAPATGQFAIVVDSASDPAPATGAYTVRVRAADCLDPAGCADGDAAHDSCFEFACVACVDGFSCDASAPACDAGACTAGFSACTDDDAREPDDGPLGATVVPVPTAGDPQSRTGAVCSAPAAEADWYSVALPADGALRFAITWTGGADLDLVVYAADGGVVARAVAVPDRTGLDAVVLDLAAGTYYAAVTQATPVGAAAGTTYDLAVSIPECRNDVQCSDGASPVCEVGVCVAGPSDCTNDDAGDAGDGDDGPAGARSLTAAVGTPASLGGRLCNTPGAEADWYRVNVGAGEGLEVEVAFAAGLDFDLSLFDDEGRLLGASFWLRPERVTLTYLPAGAIYARVIRYASLPEPAADAYTITATRTTAQACASRADCAAAYTSQIYRGACAGNGTCGFIPAGARAIGAACDSSDDCEDGFCSYASYESDAEKSVCTKLCLATEDCADVGTGFTCTTGYVNDICTPGCTVEEQCGANVRDTSVPEGEPWDYYYCTDSTNICSPG